MTGPVRAVSVPAVGACTQDGCERRSHHHTRRPVAGAGHRRCRRHPSNRHRHRHHHHRGGARRPARHRRAPLRHDRRTAGATHGRSRTYRHRAGIDRPARGRRRRRPDGAAQRLPGACRAARPPGRPGGPRRAPTPRAGTVAVVEFESGPAVAAPVALPAGRHVVGRAAGAAVRLLDERAELHHGVLDIDGTGVRFTQLTGRTPCDVGGPADSAHAERLTFALGASRISVRPAGGARRPRRPRCDAHPADPWRRTLHRAPRHHPRWVPPPVDVPAGDRRLDVLAAGRPAGDGGADARRRRGRRRAPQPDVPRALRCRRAGGAGDPPRRPGVGSPAPPSWFGRAPSGGGAVHQRARGSPPGAGGVRARDHADDR